MQKSVEKFVEKRYRKDILQDIDALHNASSVDVFNAAAHAFVAKHATKTAFIQYFKREWLVKNPNWYFGAAETLSPTTNNTLEAFNKTIKDHNTMRERFPLSRFLVVASDMVTQWSNQISEDLFPETHNIELKEWTEGYCWAKQNIKVKTLASDYTNNVYIVPSEKARATDMAYNETWHTFDEYKEKNFAFWKVVLPRTEWKKGMCNCPQFLKYMCVNI